MGIGAIQAGETATRRRGRSWRFGAAVLDEGSWTLTVGGKRVAIEAKPLQLLHELLLRAGHVVTKEELLDAVWPDVAVVEASVPTAVAKLRRALGDDRGEGAIIETVPRIGYRLVAPVVLEHYGERLAPTAEGENRGAPSPTTVPRRSRARAIAGAAALAIGAALISGGLVAYPRVATKPVTRLEVIDALRRLDATRLNDLIARGWSPTEPVDHVGDTAIDVALEVCEWDKRHDRKQLMQIVRMLLDNGDRIDRYNIFGDTAYSIAKAPRYCGPNHPATQLLHAECYSGPTAPGDKCLATYERDRRRHAQERARS